MMGDVWIFQTELCVTSKCGTVCQWFVSLSASAVARGGGQKRASSKKNVDVRPFSHEIHANRWRASAHLDTSHVEFPKLFDVHGPPELICSIVKMNVVLFHLCVGVIDSKVREERVRAKFAAPRDHLLVHLSGLADVVLLGVEKAMQLVVVVMLRTQNWRMCGIALLGRAKDRPQRVDFLSLLFREYLENLSGTFIVEEVIDRWSRRHRHVLL